LLPPCSVKKKGYNILIILDIYKVKVKAFCVLFHKKNTFVFLFQKAEGVLAQMA